TDLLACAATTGAMFAGVVEATRYPRNPLDILAQQIVAMVAVERLTVDAIFHTVRAAAPFAELPRVLFDSVVDMLAGKTAIDLGLEDHEGLRARLRFDRETGFVTATTGAHRVVVQNAGTIVDRGLYGVFLATGSESAPSVRVGELDEEMVFETRPGEVFRLGASSWRVEEITHDRVLVTPAPGEPGKLPFWRGESPLRPLELGERMGTLTRTLLSTPKAAAVDLLVREHGLVEGAGEKLVSSLLAQQDKGGGVVPDDRTLVIERGRDELGDWRVCVLSPWGAQVLQPLAMCISERADAELGVALEVATANDGVVFRFPESDEPPDLLALMPEADDVERLVLQGLAGSPMFAARFRESAARALLLPRRRPGMRAPLWKQRQRAQSLLTSVKESGEFPIVLEACRECLRDIFDVPGLVTIVEELKTGLRKVVVVDSDTPSPFAAALLSGFVRGAIYDGDVPLAERRAQALAVDHDQLKTLLGEGALRELLDDDVIAAVNGVLQATATGMGAKHADGLHALLVRLGDLSIDEITARVVDPATSSTLIDQLVADRRAVFVKVGGAVRVIAIEDVGRYRDALGTQPPAGIPEAFLTTTTNPLAALVRRYVKSHALSTANEIATRFALPSTAVTTTLQGLVRGGVLVEGAFAPGGDDVDYADPEVLRSLRRRTLARLRAEIEPVEQRTFVRARLRWQGLLRPRRGLDGLLDAIASLQGTPLLWSSVESQVLPARVVDYRPDMLDALALAGEVMWVGVEAVGEHDARVLLFLTDALPWLWRPTALVDDETPHPLRAPIVEALRARGASFFSELALRLQIAAPKPAPVAATTTEPTTTAGPPSFSTWLRDKRAAAPTLSPTSAIATATVEAELWTLAMRGVVTNDSFRPLRARLEAAKATKRRGREQRVQQPFRSRRNSTQAPAADGRWSIVMPEAAIDDVTSLTRRAAAVAEQLVRRDGVLAPEAVKEAVGDGALPLPLTAVRDALRALEDGGRIRRGYFVAELGGMQYAAPEAIEALRALPPIVDDDAEVTVLAASDPANPFGGVIAWPTSSSTSSLHRGAGARVVIVDGALAAWLPKHLQRVTTFLPVDEPERGRVGAALAKALAGIASTRRFVAGKGLLLAEIDGQIDAARDAHPLVPHLLRAGFVKSAGGLLFPRVSPTSTTRPSAPPSAWLGQASTAPTLDAASDVGISDAADDDDDSDDDLDDDDD
ncbi:MAG TPA: DEAD/DEAH box helicase, partial [Myxococcota bacterium]